PVVAQAKEVDLPPAGYLIAVVGSVEPGLCSYGRVCIERGVAQAADRDRVVRDTTGRATSSLRGPCNGRAAHGEHEREHRHGAHQLVSLHVISPRLFVTRRGTPC